MHALPNRRRVLQGALGAAAVFALPRAHAQFTPTGIGNTLTLLAGGGGNVLVLATPDGVVLVDSGASDAQLLPALGELTGGARIHTLFNTHWHLDQIGNNESIGRTGAAIVAHEKTRLHLAYSYYLPAEDRYHPPMPVQAQPTESFYTTGEKAVGGQSIEYGYLLEAHTDGDAYIHFRDSDVIAVGDALSPVRDPELDWFGGGWLGGRIDSLKQLLAISDPETRFVPSYGPVVGRAEVQREHDVLSLLFDRFFERIRKGESNEDMLAAGIMENTGRVWNDPARFVHDAHRGFWAHYNTLSHDIV
jgi:glyoxylase-like metal-dependent hydrolase (beta-lactamase superfamily II)